jgi:hypothetical protein
MNEVITRLDAIENKAGAILSDAKNRKDQLMMQLEQDKRELDAQYETKEQEYISRLKETRMAEEAGRIQKLEQENQAAIQKLNALYESDGERLAQEIFSQITSVSKVSGA